jgi:hypothetical protein
MSLASSRTFSIQSLLSTIVPGDEDNPFFHFSDERDIARGLSTDGFSPFKKRKKTCWPIILFNYNLPPEIQLSDWEKLDVVEAHTTQYMKRREVDEKLALLVNAIRVPRAQLTIDQLSTENSLVILIVIQYFCPPVSPRPLVEPIQSVKERKLCPLPVASFTGRKETPDKMHGYFDFDGQFQRFLLYGLGGSGKSQIAFRIQSQQSVRLQRNLAFCDDLEFYIFSFSDIFYVDATNQERSVDASLRWLANHRDGDWLLLFDNADDVHLELKQFLPSANVPQRFRQANTPPSSSFSIR